MVVFSMIEWKLTLTSGHKLSDITRSCLIIVSVNVSQALFIVAELSVQADKSSRITSIVLELAATEIMSQALLRMLEKVAISTVLNAPIQTL